MTENNSELLINNEQEMMHLGKLLAQASQGKGIIFLHGDLGAGKTTFCRGVLTALGHKGTVKSPTYTLLEPYRVNGRAIYHFDLYRLGDPEELEFIGGRDYFDQNSLCLVEWSSKGEGALPQPDMEITLNYNLPGRTALLCAVTDYGQQLVTATVAAYTQQQGG